MKYHNNITILLVVILLMIAKVVPETSEGGGEGGPGGYDCRNLDLSTVLGNCTTDRNPRIQISKDMNDYRIRLCSSGTNGQCSTALDDTSLNWIRCRDICDACQSLLGPNRENNYYHNYSNNCRQS